MEFRLLGPVEVWSNGQLVEVGPLRQRGVLAALAVDSGRPVQIDTLVDRIWGDAPPRGARQTLHVYLTRLRQVLASAEPSPPALIRRSGGYLLDADPDLVDVHRFRDLIDRARDLRRTGTERVELLRQALGLWRGAPLADLSGRWPALLRERWQREHVDAAVRWAQLETELGNAAAVIDPLTELTTGYPIVEPLAAALVRALYEAGRGAEALDRYARTRRHLAEELGVDPGTELQQLHQTILRAPAPAPVMPAATHARPVPAQLPPDVRGFAGRTAELDALNAIVTATDDQATTVVISAVWGTAGVGKTALAVHWAHQLRHRFPDGQLYVNLRGFDSSGIVVAPAEAIRGFLDTLGVPAPQIPASVDAAAALYRSLLADKKIMVVLDNAYDADQVRPLLPGSPGCLAVVTSRNQLTGLVATHGAHPVPLDLLNHADARELLTRRLSAGRVAAEPDAVTSIIDHCARLPLALAVVAARAAGTPGRPLASLADELRGVETSLDLLTGGEPATDMRAVLSWSYRALQPDAARLFRLLGLHPGPEISDSAAASLAGTSLPHTRRVLTELVRVHLLTRYETDQAGTGGGYGFHDLLRAYATELVHAVDSDRERSAALHRLMGHYVHTASAASMLMDPHRDRVELPAPEPGVVVAEIADYKQALSWYTAEYAALLAAVRQPASAGLDPEITRLVWNLGDYLDLRGLWHDQVTAQSAALAAASREGDLRGVAFAHRIIARAYARLGLHDQALGHLERALDAHRGLDDQAGQAHTHLGIARVMELQDQFTEALDHAQEGLRLYRVAGHLDGQAIGLNSVGWYYAKLGEHEEALVHCGQALILLQDLDDRRGQAATWDSLGYAHHHLGHHRDAIACYQRALQLYQEFGERYVQTEILTHLGDTHLALGDPDAAREVWQRAVAILDELNHPDAKTIRVKIERSVIMGGG